MQDSEARIDLLRQRAGLQGSKPRKNKDKDDVDAQIAQAKGRIDEAESGGVPGPSTLTSRTGHINLFEDLEQVRPRVLRLQFLGLGLGSPDRLVQQGMMTMTIPVRSTKHGPPPGESDRETDKGVALAPSAKDLNPWYSDRNRDRETGGGEPDKDDKR